MVVWKSKRLKSANSEFGRMSGRGILESREDRGEVLWGMRSRVEKGYVFIAYARPTDPRSPHALGGVNVNGDKLSHKLCDQSDRSCRNMRRSKQRQGKAKGDNGSVDRCTGGGLISTNPIEYRHGRKLKRRMER